MTTSDGEHGEPVVRRAAEWLFRNRHTGAITVGQFPNLALAVFGVAELAVFLSEPDGRVRLAARTLATAALTWWAADELVRGVNPWRRLLGAAVLLYLGVLGWLAVSARWAATT